MRDLPKSGVSVCLSVCPLHAGIESKLKTIGSCDFHCRTAQKLQFVGVWLRAS